MKQPLSVSELKIYLAKAEEAFRHEECATCECFLGYVVQLEIDSSPEGRAFLAGYKPERDLIHSCLGCDPCPPGILYSNYLRKKSSRIE